MLVSMVSPSPTFLPANVPFGAFLAEVIRVAYRSAAHTVEFFDGQFVHFFAFANFFAHAIHLLVCGVGTIPAP
jgi:hypothetical protein